MYGKHQKAFEYSRGQKGYKAVTHENGKPKGVEEKIKPQQNDAAGGKDPLRGYFFAVKEDPEGEARKGGCNRKAREKGACRENKHSQNIADSVAGGGPHRSEHYSHNGHGKKAEAYAENGRVNGTESRKDDFQGNKKCHDHQT